MTEAITPMCVGGRRRLVRSVALAAAGALVLLVGLAFAPQAVAVSYLVACMAVLAVVVGMLLLVMIAHLSGATWFVLLRRQSEGVVASLPALAILTLPIIVAPRAFFPWAAPIATLPVALQDAVRQKLWYFNHAFFVARAIAYWLAWLGPGELLRRMSRQQDTQADRMPPHRFRFVSAAAIPFAALAMTFAAIDWMMSLSPAWSSSVYGGYYFAGGMVSALALLAVLARRAQTLRSGWVPTSEHFQALGRLMLAFVLFWAYLWYAQFFIVWIADIPREATWYAVRLNGAWAVVAAIVLACGFALPVFVLLFRAARGSAVVMAAAGAWLLAVHYVDVYWLLVPGAGRWSLVDIVWNAGALALVGGSTTAMVIWRQQTVPPIAVGDPMLEWSVRYEAH